MKWNFFFISETADGDSSTILTFFWRFFSDHPAKKAPCFCTGIDRKWQRNGDRYLGAGRLGFNGDATEAEREDGGGSTVRPWDSNRKGENRDCRGREWQTAENERTANFSNFANLLGGDCFVLKSQILEGVLSIILVCKDGGRRVKGLRISRIARI